MGTLRRIHQPELSRCQRLSGARRVGLGTQSRLYKGLLGLLPKRPRNVQGSQGEGPRPLGA